jgi:hypothetical protein
MKTYIVLYEAGKSGTWLTWLINQHYNFPKYNSELQNRKLPTQVDINCLGADWWPDKQSFKNNRLSKTIQHCNNDNAIKDCVKVLPNHELRAHITDIDIEKLKAILKSSNINNIIIPHLFEQMYDPFRMRWNLLLKEKGDNKYKSWDEINMKEFMDYHIENKTYEVFPDTKVHYMDIGKLVMGNLREYSKLLSFIEEEPLEDFKTITTDYREFAFGKYMK